MLRISKRLKYVSAFVLTFVIGMVIKNVSEVELRDVKVFDTAHADVLSTFVGDGSAGGSGDASGGDGGAGDGGDAAGDGSF